MNASALLPNITEDYYYYYKNEFYFQPWHDGIVKSYFIIVSIVGGTLNILTILAILLGKYTNKEVKIQLINLAIADCVMAAFYPTVVMKDRLNLPFVGDTAWCTLQSFISLSAVHASPLCNAAISLERAVIILFPFKAVNYRTKHKFIVVGLVWLCATVPELVVVSSSAVFTDEYGNRFCDIGINIPVNTYELLVTLRYAIPAFIIVISYSVVFVKLCVRRKSHLVHASTQNSKKQQEATAKLQLMLMVDAFLTLATWLPNTMYYTVVQYQNKPPEFTEEEFVVEVVLAGLTCTNAFSTPLVYLTFNNYFRMDMKLLFNRLPCCKHRPKATSVTAKLAENCNHSASQSSSAKQNSTRKSSQQTASTQATVAIIEEKQSVR